MRIQKSFSAVSLLTSKPTAAACAQIDPALRQRVEIRSTSSRAIGCFSAARKILLIVLSVVAVVLCCGFDSGAGSIDLSAFTGVCAPLPSPSAPNFNDRLTAFVENSCYAKQNWQHDENVRTSEGVHAPFIKIWYSPSLYLWMTRLKRLGPVTDGAIAIKEEFLTQTGPVQFRSVMVRDSKLWWDGWFWEVVGIEDLNSPASASNSAGCPEPQFPAYGAGLTCLNCHSSAVANFQGTATYSSTAYIHRSSGSAEAAAAAVSAGPLLPGAAPMFFGAGALLNQTISTQAPTDPDPTGFTGRLPSSIFANVKTMQTVPIPCMVPESQDQATAKPAAFRGIGTPSQFVTSDQCAGCHDANDLVSFPTNMFYTPPGETIPVNLSQYGEWRYSMMGLSGRDPIFFAQLDTESTVHSNLKGKRNAPAFIQDTCLSCHGVMGQRQYHLDKGNAPNTLFTRDQLNDPKSRYGALARDGVSCTVCHHIADKDLDDPSTYTGKFKVGPANEIYGPYPSGTTDAKVGNNVIRRPMINALGITPVYGAQTTRANLCESCHTIVLPIYDANGNPVMEGGVPKTDFEQTTYFEWLNSSFVNQPCQECHMPDNYKGAKLAFKVANIEDSTFPRFPEIGDPAIDGSTTLPASNLIVQTRTEYPRHQLLGVNVFALDMFDQFRTQLGMYMFDSWLPLDLAPEVSEQRNAVDSAVTQAQTSTAEVTFDSVTKSAGQLVADVRIQNLAGHNLPSGVSFRRAFLDLQVLDAQGSILWESGGTNADGVITDTAGHPLVTEFFSPTQQTYQRHFWTGNPIMRDDQVQIYEELIRDPQGQFTTSFLSLDDKVKDNRLQPLGRSSSGPNAGITAPVGTGEDPNYQNGCGCSVVRYQLALTGGLANAAKVQATLFYQSIPPYYLRQRAEDANGPDTARLIKFTNELNLNDYPEISDWKLRISSSGLVNIQ